MFICAGAASAAIPIGPAGAATHITAGTMLLVAVALPHPDACLDRNVASQGLVAVRLPFDIVPAGFV
jgi:hypothetical protein